MVVPRSWTQVSALPTVLAGDDLVTGGGGERLSHEEAVRALKFLTPVERFFCGKFVLRQLSQVRSVPRELSKYGVEGTVRLCSGRAINLYVALVGIVAVAFAVGGLGVVALPLFSLMALLLILVLLRAASATRAGRRWRSAR